MAIVRNVPNMNQKIKIKIEVSQERGSEPDQDHYSVDLNKDNIAQQADKAQVQMPSNIHGLANQKMTNSQYSPNGRQFKPIDMKELSLTGNGISHNHGSPRGKANISQQIDEQVQSGTPNLGVNITRIPGTQESQGSQERRTTSSIGRNNIEGQIISQRNSAGIFQQIKSIDNRLVSYSRMVDQRNKDRYLLSRSTDAPQSSDRSPTTRQMDPQFALESQRYRQPTIPQAQNRQPYNSQIQNISNLMQVNSIMGWGTGEPMASGRNSRTFGTQGSQNSPRSIMGEPHFKDKNRFLEELPDMIKRRQLEQLQKFRHFEKRSQMDSNMRDLFSQFHEFQDSNNILRESNPMFEVAPTPWYTQKPSNRVSQNINISIQNHERKPTRDGSNQGAIKQSNRQIEKPWTVSAAQAGLGRARRVRGQLQPLDPINSLLSVSACFSQAGQRATALSGPRKEPLIYQRDIKSHLENRKNLEIATELPVTPLSRIGVTSQGFYTAHQQVPRKSLQVGQLRTSNLLSSKQSPRNATAGLTAFTKSFGLQGVSPRSKDARSSIQDEVTSRKNYQGYKQRREKNRAIKNQRNYAAKQIRPDQIAKGEFRLSSRVINTDKFNHYAQKMIIQHDQRNSKPNQSMQSSMVTPNSEANYEFKVNGRYQKIIQKCDKQGDSGQQAYDGSIKVVDQIQIGEGALYHQGVGLSDEIETASRMQKISKNISKANGDGDLSPEARSSALLRPLPKLPTGQGSKVESMLIQDSENPGQQLTRPTVRRLLSTSYGGVESMSSEKGVNLIGNEMEMEMVRAQQRTGIPGPRSRYGVNLDSKEPSQILEADFKNEGIAQQLRDSAIVLDQTTSFSPSQFAQPTVKTVYALHGGRKIEDIGVKQGKIDTQPEAIPSSHNRMLEPNVNSVSGGGSQSGASQPPLGITKISQISHSVLAEQRAIPSRQSKRLETQQTQHVMYQSQLPSNAASSLVANENLRKIQCKSREGGRGSRLQGQASEAASSKPKPANKDLPKEVQEQIQ